MSYYFDIGDHRIYIHVSEYPTTDELYTEFYACPACLFERVPYSRNEDKYIANYCPGCGGELEWI